MMKLILCDDDPKFLEYMKRFLISELGFTTIILTCTDYKSYLLFWKQIRIVIYYSWTFVFQIKMVSYFLRRF